MPRVGGIYSPPAGTAAVPNTTIQSTPYNAYVDDITADLNAARPITAGGTGATTASGARTALGLAIGTDVQAYDAGLASIAGLTTSADKMIYTTAADAYATTALTPFARTLLDDADAATAKTTLDIITASQAEAEAATDNAKFMTPLRTGQTIDGRATKLYGASSLARTIPARFSDTVNLRDWFDRTGAEGTETANNTALAALITYLTANPSVRTLKGNKGDVYRITAVDQVLPSGVRLMMDGARFRWSGLLGGGSSQFLQFGTGSHIEGMGIDIVTASTFRRLLGSDTDCVWFDNEILAEAQINNYGGSLLDWMIRVYRDNNKVRGLKIKNIDKAFFAYGADGDGDPGVNNHFEDIRVESYVTGICLRNLAGARLLNPYVKTKSANAIEDPGHNGILHEGIKDYLLANAQVADSGEHGIRFGGTRNLEQASIGITVNGAQIYRSGQCGFKMFTGTVGQTFANVQVSNVQVVDCAYNGGAAETPGFNDEGFLLQQIRKGTFSGLSVQRQENPTYSCMDGVYVSGSDNLQINGLHVQDPKRNAVRISETDDDGGGLAIETLANNEVSVLNIVGENIGEDGIFIDHPTQSVRDLSIHARDLIGNGVAGFYAVDGNAAIARFTQPTLVEVKQRNFAAGLQSLGNSGNWKVRDIFGSTY